MCGWSLLTCMPPKFLMRDPERFCYDQDGILLDPHSKMAMSSSEQNVSDAQMELSRSVSILACFLCTRAVHPQF